MHLRVAAHPDPQVAAMLAERVRRDAVLRSGHGDELDLSVLAYDDDVLVAGVCGWTWGGCGEVESLWVEPARRGCGLGRRLLAWAEREAVARDCRLMVAFTHQHQAPGFYERCGYELVGRVDDYPRGSAAQWFRKELLPG